MATVNVTQTSFKQTVEKGLVLVDFWAPWCGPCRMFGPIFERVSDKHPEATFAKINTENEPGIAQAFEISSIPTLMVIRDGVLLLKQPGMLPEAALESLIDQAMKLDMDEVRKHSVPSRSDAS
ncbi:MAG: thioredoxin [Polyangiaceae bacterium]